MFNIITYDELNSTNKFALENISKIEADTIICAKIQTSGRGRFERKWISDKKDNCYISFVLKPKLEYKNNFPNLTQYLSVVLCKTLISYGVKPKIKWPNDVQIDGKKISGILSEASFSNGNFNGIILGIGVNLNLEKSDLKNIDIPATSLNLEINKKVDSKYFIENLVENFYNNYEKFLQLGFKYIRNEYISYCNFLGKQILIRNPKLQNLGIAKNICLDGTLELEKNSGEIIKILSGDVVIAQ